MALQNQLPSSHWTSYQEWTDETLRLRLQRFMSAIDKTALVEHTTSVLGKAMAISEPFSAGEFWCCFELTAEDGSLVIARLRLPKHPNSHGLGDDTYSMACEVATMRFVQAHVPKVPVPKVYAFGDCNSEGARKIGAPYMLIEGFYGNTLFDVEWNLCKLQPSIQRHIITQWTAIIAELATVQLPRIGSISEFSESNGATIGKLSYAEMDRLVRPGPFESVVDYYTTMIDTKRHSLRDKEAHKSIQLAYYVYRDIVQNSSVFKEYNEPPFTFNHMDLDIHNFLIDGAYNIIAVIDWEFAQSAPWHEHSYPMLFAPFGNVLGESEEAILRLPDQVRCGDVSLREVTRQLYKKGFDDAERELHTHGRDIRASISTILDSKGARIKALAGILEHIDLMHIEQCTLEMIRIAYKLDEGASKQYLRRMDQEMTKDVN